MVKVFKRTVSVAITCFVVFASVACGFDISTVESTAGAKYIDNSSLVDPYITDDKVTLDEQGWPTWTNNLVLAECRIETASPDGTIYGMEPILKHFAETGVNGLWVTPVEDKGLDIVGSTYCAYGPDTINPFLTGQIAYGQQWNPNQYRKDNGDAALKAFYDEGRRRFADFVDTCHKYNIRIFFDKVPWGVSKQAILLEDHPTWAPSVSSWGGMDYNKNLDAVKEYYYDSNIQFILATGCDGIRWDLEPHHFGYEFIEDMHYDILTNYESLLKRLVPEAFWTDSIKAHLAGGYPQKILFWSEDMAFHGKAYAFEQFGGIVGSGCSSQYSCDVFFNDIDIVESIRTGDCLGIEALRNTGDSGQSRYYCYQISSHDNIHYHGGTMAAWAYEYLYGSFIPLWYIGDELNFDPGVLGSCFGWKVNGVVNYSSKTTDNGVQTFIPSDTFQKALNNPAQRAYFEEVKELISYRWKYKEIINKSTENHRDTNIASVKVKGQLIQGYARYLNDKAFIVIPNVDERSTKAADITFAIPFAHMGDTLRYNTKYKLSNVRTGEVLKTGSAKDLQTYTTNVKHNECNLFLLEAIGVVDKTVKNTEATFSNDDYDSYDYDSYDDEELEEEELDEEEIGPKKKLIRRLKKIASDMGLPLWAIIAIIAGGVVVIGGGVTVAVIVIKKKSKK